MNAFLNFIKSLDLRNLNEISITLRFVLAVLCGGLIGLEREHKHRPAGFRTHILVCIGAASTTMTSQYLLTLRDLFPGNFLSDPMRLGAQVIAGIGFIGAGTIIVTSRRQVKGLTTAAGLWACAIVGLAIGVGYYEAALYTTFLILITEILLFRIDLIMRSATKYLNVYIEYTNADILSYIMDELKNMDVRISDVEVAKTKIEDGAHISAILSLELPHKAYQEKVLTAMSEVEGICSIEEL